MGKKAASTSDKADVSGQAILVVDIGGNNLKLRHSHHAERRKTSTGPELTPERAVAMIKEHTADWDIERVTIGCPGPVRHNRLTLEPVNLGSGWVGFDFEAAMAVPTRVVNDAVMQAIGSYEGDKMLFLGLGTGLGAALVLPHVALPLEVAHLPYRPPHTYEDCIGRRGLDRLGRKSWEEAVHDIVRRMRDALLADYVILGGGNTKKLKQLPPDTRPGSNANAFSGGFRIWQEDIQPG